LEIAGLEVENAIVSLSNVETDLKIALGPSSEGKFHLIPIIERGRAPQSRPELTREDISRGQRTAHHLILQLQLIRIAEVLPAAATTGAEMAAGRLPPWQSDLQNLHHPGLHPALPFPSDNCVDGVSGNGPSDDHFDAVHTSQTVSLRRQLLNLQCDLLSALDWHFRKTPRHDL
jgi:hypothetical protein